MTSRQITVPLQGVVAEPGGPFHFTDTTGQFWCGRCQHYHQDGDVLMFGGEVTAGPEGSSGQQIDVTGGDRLLLTMVLND